MLERYARIKRQKGDGFVAALIDSIRVEFGDEPFDGAAGFPEARRLNFSVGGKSGLQLMSELAKGGVIVGSLTSDMLAGRDLGNPQPAETIDTLILRLEKDLNIHDDISCPDLIKKILKEGLDICPKATGPHMRITYKNQPEGEWAIVLSDPITDYYGDPRLFGVVRYGGGLRLDSHRISSRLRPNFLVVARLRK